MSKISKHLFMIVGVFVISIFLFTGCLKEGNDTIVLPLPDGKIPYSLIPESLQDSLRAHGFEINEGIEPPMIMGKYLSSPMQLQYASDNYINDFADLYMLFEGQNRRGIVRYSESQRDTVVGNSLMANVIGKGDKFSMYCYQKVSHCNSEGDTLWNCNTATVVSGTITDTGIAKCQYTTIILDHWAVNNYYASRIPKAETYRIWNDGDGFAVKLTK